MTDRLAAISVRATASIRDAMRAIDAGGAEIALIVDDDGRLQGTLTDGDVRRALLAGADLDAACGPYGCRDFVSAPAGTDRATALDLMRARSVPQIPLLDRDGRVEELHLMRELIGFPSRANTALILAGGRGARLRPITEQIPKPMVCVAGRPILERIVLHLVGSGITSIQMAVNYLSDMIESHFRDGSAFGCSINYIREPEATPLGTGGSIGLLPSDVLETSLPILVMNGDLLAQFDVDRMFAVHEGAGAAVTVGVRAHSYHVPFGVVRLDASRDVVELVEKPTKSWLVSAGVYVISTPVARRVPRERSADMTEIVADCLARGERVVQHSLEGEWMDVGTPESLRDARGQPS